MVKKNIKQTTSPKAFDIIHPGKTPAQPSGKPIIITTTYHNDPMVARTHAAKSLQKDQKKPKVMSPVATKSSTKTEEASYSVVVATEPIKSHRLRTMLVLLVGILVLFIGADFILEKHIWHTNVTAPLHLFEPK